MTKQVFTLLVLLISCVVFLSLFIYLFPKDTYDLIQKDVPTYPTMDAQVQDNDISQNTIRIKNLERQAVDLPLKSYKFLSLISSLISFIFAGSIYFYLVQPLNRPNAIPLHSQYTVLLIIFSFALASYYSFTSSNPNNVTKSQFRFAYPVSKILIDSVIVIAIGYILLHILRILRSRGWLSYKDQNVSPINDLQLQIPQNGISVPLRTNIELETNTVPNNNLVPRTDISHFEIPTTRESHPFSSSSNPPIDTTTVDTPTVNTPIMDTSTVDTTTHVVLPITTTTTTPLPSETVTTTRESNPSSFSNPIVDITVDTTPVDATPVDATTVDTTTHMELPITTTTITTPPPIEPPTTTTPFIEGPSTMPKPEHVDLNVLNQKLAVFQRTLRAYRTRGEEVEITINRPNLLNDAYRIISQFNELQLRSRLAVIFEDEDGTDAGGLLVDLFLQLSKAFDPQDGHFRYGDDRLRVLEIDPNSPIPGKFDYLGKLLALYLFNNLRTSAKFGLPFLKAFLDSNARMTIEDVGHVDLQLYSFLTKLRDFTSEDQVEGYDLYMCYESYPLTFDLIPDGRDTQVTLENREQYLRLFPQVRLVTSTANQMALIRQGFNKVIPIELIQQFTPTELQILFTGIETIDITDWKTNMLWVNLFGEPALFNATKACFERLLDEMTEDGLRKLLKFVTASDRLPIGGFSGFSPKFQVWFFPSPDTAGRLPEGHTCANTLYLYRYPDYATFKDKITQALDQVEEAFGLH